MLLRFAPHDSSAGASLFRFESITSPRGYHLHVRNYRRKANPTGNKLTTTRDNFKQNHTFKRNRTSGTPETTVCSSGPSIGMTLKFANFRLTSKFNVRFAIQIARIQKYRVVRSIPSDILAIVPPTGILYGNDYGLSKFIKKHD